MRRKTYRPSQFFESRCEHSLRRVADLAPLCNTEGFLSTYSYHPLQHLASRDSRLRVTWMTSPEPSSPASVSGVSVTVALWVMALATAFNSLALYKGATLRTWGLEARYETSPMKHATCSSSDSAPADPPTPLPPARRWSTPVRNKRSGFGKRLVVLENSSAHSSLNIDGTTTSCSTR